MICVVEDASETKHGPGEQDENRLQDQRALARRKYVKFFQRVMKTDARVCIRCRVPSWTQDTCGQRRRNGQASGASLAKNWPGTAKSPSSSVVSVEKNHAHVSTKRDISQHG